MNGNSSREPPLSPSPSLSSSSMGSKSRLLEWGSSVSINFDKPCVEFESTRLSSTMRVKNNRDELADEIYIYIYIYIHGWKTRSVHRGSVYRGRIFPFRRLTARPMDYLSSLYQPRREKWRSFVSGGRTSGRIGAISSRPRSNDARVPLPVPGRRELEKQLDPAYSIRPLYLYRGYDIASFLFHVGELSSLPFYGFYATVICISLSLSLGRTSYVLSFYRETEKIAKERSQFLVTRLEREWKGFFKSREKYATRY